jgi:hypothetical protein
VRGIVASFCASSTYEEIFPLSCIPVETENAAVVQSRSRMVKSRRGAGDGEGSANAHGSCSAAKRVTLYTRPLSSTDCSPSYVRYAPPLQINPGSPPQIPPSYDCAVRIHAWHFGKVRVDQFVVLHCFGSGGGGGGGGPIRLVLLRQLLTSPDRGLIGPPPSCCRQHFQDAASSKHFTIRFVSHLLPSRTPSTHTHS